jgi:hypothetical protein
VSIAGLVLLPLLIVVAVPLTAGRGPGGAGMGVAMALSARELVIVLVFLAVLRSKALDRRAAAALVKSLGICVVVVVANHFMVTLPPLLRLSVDALLYLVLMLATRVLAPSDLEAVLKMVKDRKKAQLSG